MAEVPLYGKVEQVLASEIANGTFRPGDRIPTEDQLLARFGVSRITVRRAIQNLVHKGLLQIRRGHGTFVLPPQLTQELSQLTGFVEDMALHGRKPSTCVLGHGLVPASETVARHLRLSQGTMVMRIERVRLADEVALSFDETFLPLPLGEQIVTNDLQEHPIFSLLEDKYGIPLTEAVYAIEAVSASPRVAEALALAPGTPILRVERTSCTTEGQPIDYELLSYRGDLIRFTTRLQRQSLP